MRWRKWFWSPLATFAVAGVALPASSQDQLEHGFVEPCTLANVQEGGLDCEVCSSAFGSRACSEKLGPRGYAKKCRTRGSHDGWEEIWCAPRQAPSKRDGVWGLLLGAAGTLVAAALVLRVIAGKAKA